MVAKKVIDYLPDVLVGCSLGERRLADVCGNGAELNARGFTTARVWAVDGSLPRQEVRQCQRVAATHVSVLVEQVCPLVQRRILATHCACELAQSVK